MKKRSWWSRLQSPQVGQPASAIRDLPPQAWWDQRNVLDSNPVEQPASIDYTDLHQIGWRP